MDTPATKKLSTLLLLSVLLINAAILFAVIGDAPHTLILTMLGLGVSFVMRRPLPRNLRSFVYAATAVLIVTVLEDQFLPIDPHRFFLLPAHIYCPAVIFLGVGATFFDQRDTNLVAVLALALIATMLAGNTVVAVMYNPRFPVSEPLLRNFTLVYSVVVVLQMLTMLALLARIEAPRGARPARRRYSWRRRGIATLALLTAVVSVAGLRQAALAYERLMQQTFHHFFQRYMLRRGGWIVFDEKVDLRRTIPYRSRRDKRVVLRVVAEKEPGYLRGWAFTRYGRGQWLSGNKGEALAATETAGRLAHTVFRRTAPHAPKLPAPDAASETMQIYPAGNFRSQVLLAPGTGWRFELIADNLTNNADGVLRPREWDLGGAYTVTATDPRGRDRAYPAPRQPTAERREYLTVPGDLEALLQEVAGQVFSGPPRPADPGSSIREVVTYLQRHCRYELGVRYPPRQDPIAAFLTEQPRGHCELFATAAVLLLRTHGIPARYVTGFVCLEPHPSFSHWLARLRDAHAWVEAYSPRERRWLTVEPTPAAGVPGAGPVPSFFGAATDRFVLAWQRLLALVKRGYVAEVIAALAAEALQVVRWLLWHPIRGLMALALATLLVRHWWQRRRPEPDGLLSPSRRALRQVLTRIEKYTVAFGVERPASTTVREWSRAIQAAGKPVPGADVITGLLREYEQLRYRPQSPSAASVRSFEEKVRRQLPRRRRWPLKRSA